MLSATVCSRGICTGEVGRGSKTCVSVTTYAEGSTPKIMIACCCASTRCTAGCALAVRDLLGNCQGSQSKAVVMTSRNIVVTSGGAKLVKRDAASCRMVRGLGGRTSDERVVNLAVGKIQYRNIVLGRESRCVCTCIPSSVVFRALLRGIVVYLFVCLVIMTLV